MVWYTLCEAIHRVEGVAGIRCRHDPLVMWFVQRLVNRRIVQTPVDPVDTQIGEGNEQRELEEVVECKRSVRRSVVEFPKTTNFKQEEGRGENCH